jgi:D-alanyl-D-alanine carboxypeptidase
LRYSSAKTATVKDGSGKDLWMRNHNRILRMDKFHIYNPDGTEAVDGLKTGYINAGGSSIVLTGTRSGKRAIVVVLGSASSDAREEAAAKLMRDALGAIAW